MGRLYPGERRNARKTPQALQKMTKRIVKVTEHRMARRWKQNLAENRTDLEEAYMRMVVPPEYVISAARLKAL